MATDVRVEVAIHRAPADVTAIITKDLEGLNLLAQENRPIP